MKNFTRDQIEIYELGSPLWAGLGNRILVKGANEVEFWNDVRAAKPGFANHLDNSGNRALTLEEYGRRFGQATEIVFSRLIEVISDLMLTFDPRFDVAQDAEPEEPKLTKSQLAWQEYRIFSEAHSSNECRARARVDEGYASFMRKNMQREFVAEVGDAVVNLNANRTPTTKKVGDEVREFAAFYRTASTDEIRKRLSPGLNPLGPAEAASQQKLFDAAVAASMI